MPLLESSASRPASMPPGPVWVHSEVGNVDSVSAALSIWDCGADACKCLIFLCRAAGVRPISLAMASQLLPFASRLCSLCSSSRVHRLPHGFDDKQTSSRSAVREGTMEPSITVDARSSSLIALCMRLLEFEPRNGAAGARPGVHTTSMICEAAGARRSRCGQSNRFWW
eukprot:scaffold297251_cov26-Tisochrysis_lutea.AAC.5